MFKTKFALKVRIVQRFVLAALLGSLRGYAEHITAAEIIYVLLIDELLFYLHSLKD